MKTDFARLLSKYLTVYLPINYNASENTILSYRDTFKLLLRFAESEMKIVPEKITLEMISREFVLKFQSWLLSQQNAHSTVNHRTAAIRAFFRYAQREKPELITQCKEILDIPLQQSEKATVNYISVEGIKRILEQPDTANKYGLRDLAMLGLLYESAARVSELISLTPRDIRLTTAPIVSVLGKGRKHRHCPFPNNVAENLRLHMSTWKLDKPEKADSPLFVNHKNEKLGRAGVAYVLNKYADMARKISPAEIPPSVTPHMIRHSKAMHMLQSGVNLIYIRDWLGHMHVRTTEIYARADDVMKQNALKRAAATVIPQATGHSWLDEPSMIEWLNSLG